MDAATFIALLGALGVGGLINQTLSNSSARRDSRATVLAALSDVENARWIPATHEEWRDALRRFQAAALVAGLPRTEIEEYLVVAQAARWASAESAENDPTVPEEALGWIDGGLSEAAREAAASVGQAVWQGSLRRRWTAKRRMREVQRAVAAVTDPAAVNNLRQSRRHGGW